MDVEKDIGVGALIAEERSAKGWTQKELAGRIGVSTALVGRWETGDVIVTRRNAERVAEVLGIDKETVVTKAFVESMAETRRKDHRRIQREYANYPQVLRLAEAMGNCPSCSQANRELEKISRIDANFLDLALESVDIGVYILDTKGTIVYTNKSVKKIVEADNESLLGRDIRFFSTNTEVIQSLLEQVLTKGSYVGTAELERADRRKTRVVFLSYLIRNAYGNPVGVIGFLCTLDTFKIILEQLFAEASVSFSNRTEGIDQLS
jgi:PAS domain S-box-containing protein